MHFRGRSFFIITFLFAGVSLNAYANPQGENVVSGSATFDRSTPNTLTINTASSKTIVNYNSFSIAANETTRINQPSAGSAVLNRVVGVNPSAIYGTLSSNGKIFLVNPNGIIFGPGSQVNAPAILASTLDINNADFLNGNYNFFKNGGSSYIINQGRLAASPGGYIALLSQAVNNQGVIIADLGSVALAAGEKMTLALDSQSQISVVIDQAVQSEVLGPDGRQIHSAIPNSGTIQANGGKVLLTAKVLNDVFDYAVNNSGVIEATALQNNNGVVELTASGDVVNTGLIDTSILNEKAYSFTTTGTITGGSAYLNNQDGATKHLSGNIGSSISDRGDLDVTGNITLIADNLTFKAGTSGTGAFIDNSGFSINSQSGHNYNLTIDAASNSTLDLIGNAQSLGILTLGRTAGATGTCNFTANGDINLAQLTIIGAHTAFSAGSNTITLSGNWTNNGTFTAGTSTVIFDGSGTQTLNSGNYSFYNITHSGSGDLRLITDPLTVTHNFTNSAGIFDLNGKNWTMSGATFSNNNGILQAKGAEHVTGLVMDTTYGSVNYDGTSTYTGLNFGNVYNNLIFNGSGGTWKPTGAVTINGTLTVSNGTYNANGKTTTAAGLTSVSGGTYQTSGATQTFSGGLTINGGTFTGSTGNVTTTGVTLSSGTLTAPSGTFDVSGNWSQTGGTFAPGSNTVTFNGSGAQSIGGNTTTTFNNLNINNSHNVILNTNINVNTLTLTSGKLEITVNATGVNKIYDGTTAATANLSSFEIVNKAPSFTYTTASFGNKDVGTSIPVTVSGLSLSGVNDYTLSSTSASTTANITPASLTVTANNQSKTYGTALSLGTSAFTTNGLLNSDTVTGVTLTSSGAAATANVAGSPYSIIPSAAVGSGLGNYTITYHNGSLTVNPAALSITANDQSKTYGTALSLGTSAFTTNGLLNSDTVTGVTLTSSGAAATANVAGSPYSIIPSAAVGSGLGNYTITYHNGSLTVNPVPLTVTSNTNLINSQLANGIIPLPTGNLVNQFFNTHNPPAPGVYFYHPLTDIDSSSFDSSFLDLSDETFEFIDGRLNIVGP